MVSRKLGESEADVLRQKRLMVILHILDDNEVALLNAYERSHAGVDRRAFERVNRPDPAYMQSSPDKIERDRLYKVVRERSGNAEPRPSDFGSRRSASASVRSARGTWRSADARAWMAC